MNERDKIIDIVERSRTCGINNSCYECKYDKELENYKDMSCSTLRIADALIANGIGDVAEWKRRAEVAERALRNITERASCNICDNFSCRYYEGINFDYNAEDCIKWWLAQAEKELAEEKSNEAKRVRKGYQPCIRPS